ncbi:hypothetical protein GYA49_00820 [Candidatus Beckwithbacteria bacterium]|nr:hypothetical protein [Candidatus Beckwithbacteria bacterium]
MKFPKVVIDWKNLFKAVVLLLFLAILVWQTNSTEQTLETYYQTTTQLSTAQQNLSSQSAILQEQLQITKAALDDLKSQDQYLINKDLEATISAIETTYTQAVTTYEDLLKLKELTSKTTDEDKAFTQSLVYLSKRNYASASATLKTLQSKITAAKQEIISTFTIPENVPVNNSPPGSGFSTQQVSMGGSNYLVSLVAGDLGSTRVLVDTASDQTCGNDCPTLSLADYVSRNGAYAGINGSYFCPASYPSCAGKTNSFDTLLMNKNKVYFNSDNNVYSSVPAVIFGDGWIRFVGRSQDWGRDTGIDSMIANQPMLVSGGQSVFGGDGDPKKGSKGPRSFVASKGNTVYIGVVFNATVAESALVLQTLGMENALNLDSGGSTALWYSGYKVGPGRNLPNAIVLARK